eukprot:CAMPEP_0116879564 /NCGR_PEP_ID=MMETSP0463-20121206/11376_1 /TAXON_ID=181622 /ORGANISM="Strombidinopsis sp, Strain SopsisLIS2011" /LENGTH=100 /DNA_ID=CAMNT_0004529035 /DNA_START=229 /DNA_END=531 /DNA_ORIENTATION=-
MVADGVGGWNDSGVDPAKFSKFLCKKVGELYDQDMSRALKDILVDAVKQNPNKGSSTAVMAKLSTDANEFDILETCNLGDSAYLIVRPNFTYETVFRSKE